MITDDGHDAGTHRSTAPDGQPHRPTGRHRWRSESPRERDTHRGVDTATGGTVGEPDHQPTETGTDVRLDPVGAIQRRPSQNRTDTDLIDAAVAVLQTRYPRLTADDALDILCLSARSEDASISDLAFWLAHDPDRRYAPPGASSELLPDRDGDRHPRPDTRNAAATDPPETQIHYPNERGEGTRRPAHPSPSPISETEPSVADDSARVLAELRALPRLRARERIAATLADQHRRAVGHPDHARLLDVYERLLSHGPDDADPETGCTSCAQRWPCQTIADVIAAG